MKIRIRIQGFLIFLSFTITILLSKFLFPHWKEGPGDEFLDAIGVGLVLFGFLFRISARGYKAEKSQDGTVLMTTGPYALMRNPMYFGTLLIGLGIVLILFQWWTFLLFMAVFLTIYLPQIHKEEQRLCKQFGSEYVDYCKKMPKYFPCFLSLFKLDLRDYLPLKWPWIKKEFISLLAVIGIILAIEGWEDARLFGYHEYIKELLELFLIIVSFIVVFMLLYGKNSQEKH